MLRLSLPAAFGPAPERAVSKRLPPRIALMRVSRVRKQDIDGEGENVHVRQPPDASGHASAPATWETLERLRLAVGPLMSGFLVC